VHCTDWFIHYLVCRRGPFEILVIVTTTINVISKYKAIRIVNNNVFLIFILGASGRQVRHTPSFSSCDSFKQHTAILFPSCAELKGQIVQVRYLVLSSTKTVVSVKCF
jgi:hypothetical protein